MTKTLVLCALCATLLAQEHDHDHHTEHTEETSVLPAVSLTVDMSFVHRSLNDNEVAGMELPGITHQLLGESEHAEHGHMPSNANNGFNLNYAELKLDGKVSEQFNAETIFHFSEEGVGIEEAFITTNALPIGLQLKGGKFRSAFGRLNGEHRHEWDFSDIPLVYAVFLGDHGINETGVQVQYALPAAVESLIGVELLQGENEQTFGSGAIDVLGLEPASQPNLLVAFAKTALTYQRTSLDAGLSYARGKSRADHLDDADEPYAFGGESQLFGIDFTLSSDFGNHHRLTWQNEWLYRDIDGDYYDGTTLLTSVQQKQQAGFYSQLTYAFDTTWRTGIRYDNIYQNDLSEANVALNMPTDFQRYTLMGECNFDESARLRIQYDRNTALYNENGERQDLDSIIVQLTFLLGEHEEH